MPLKKFPTGTKQWISLPADLVGDPGGTSSFEVEMPYAKVDLNGDLFDDPDRFKPMVKLELVSNELHSPNCGRYPYKRNTGMRCISIWLAKIDAAEQVEPGSTPPPVELQFRQVIQGHAVVRTTGQLTPTSYDDDGLIVQLEGLLSTGVEVWGRVPPQAIQKSVNIWLAIIFDRFGGPDKILKNTPFFQ